MQKFQAFTTTSFAAVGQIAMDHRSGTAFGGRDRSKENGHKTKRTKHKCESKFKVTQIGQIAKITTGSFEHTHPVTDEYLTAWCRPDSETIQQIAIMTERGCPPAQIRKELRLQIPAQMLYSSNRKAGSYGGCRQEESETGLQMQPRIPEGSRLDSGTEVVTEEELEELAQLSEEQLALYNRFHGVFQQFIHQIAEPKHQADRTWVNGTFMSQWIVARDTLLGSPGIPDRLTLIAIILKLNYNMDTVSEELADHLMRLVQEIEHNPREFTPRSVEIRDDELEVPISDVELLDEDYQGPDLPYTD